ncbi:MAG: NAD-dependent epimerase/dehydratase family protein [Candidatus Komeilibacteria bacterium]|nr:NAD-dependent epimerase/dehydratase family protein [Candidatus Komeilibacteria bacterium]
MSKILVTGGAGFIGSHLVDRLIAKNHQVAVVDNLSTGKLRFVNRRAKFYKVSVTSPKLKQVFGKFKPEIVFHLAAQKSVPFSVNDPLADATTNIWGSLKTIEQSIRVGVKKFVLISTGGAIYGATKIMPTPEIVAPKPDSPYGLSKLTVENYLLNYYQPLRKLNFVSLRLANVFGPRQDPDGEAGVVAIFVKNLLANKQCFITGNGKQTRDFVFVDDVVEACLKSIRAGQGIYNIGTGKETSIKVLYHLIAGLISKREPKFVPPRPGDVFRSVLKNALAKRDLGWQAQVELVDGLKKTIKYFKA